MHPHLLAVTAAWPVLLGLPSAEAPLPAAAPALVAEASPQQAPVQIAPATRLDNPFDDDRRTLARFFGNAGRNMAGMWSHESLAPLLTGMAVVGATSFLDNDAERYFERNPMRDLGRAGGASGRATYVAASALSLLALSQTVGGDRFRAAAYDTSQAVMVNTAYTFALKSAVGRRRPDGSNRMSFPSGHTSNAFAIATVWSRHYGARAGVPAYTLASLVGVSRMATHKHHLSDVVAGATLGYLVGATVVRGNGGTLDGSRSRRLSLAADAGPSGDGLGLSLRLDFSPRRAN